MLEGSAALEQGNLSRAQLTLWEVAVQISVSGFLLALAALVTQVVAWARGELRAPTPGGG